MYSVSLFYLEQPDIKISMDLYFTEKNQLFFDGYDIGKAVEKHWGDSDYEYTYTIEPEEADKFYPLFNVAVGDRQALLQALKEHFGGNRAYSLMREFMKANDIKFDAFT